MVSRLSQASVDSCSPGPQLLKGAAVAAAFCACRGSGKTILSSRVQPSLTQNALETRPPLAHLTHLPAQQKELESRFGGLTLVTQNSEGLKSGEPWESKASLCYRVSSGIT